MSERPRPLNYTTKVPVEQTVAELGAMLAAHGAATVSTTYSPAGRPTGLAFVLATATGPLPFVFPVDPDAMHRALKAARARGDFASLKASAKVLDGYVTREHAERVAWRVVRDWLEANLALVAAELATVDQIMLPYLEVDPGVSLYARFADRQLSLTSGGS